MSDAIPDPPPTAGRARRGRTFDKTIVEGPIREAVWKLAWPTMLQNIIGGLQGLVDHAMVGNYVGYTGNAAIGVSWQIFLVVVVFISSLFTGMGVLVARFAGADEPDKVNRVVQQAFLTSVLLVVVIMAPVGWFLSPTLLDLVNATAEVQAEALPYLRTMFVFSFGMLMFFMLGGALRSAGDAQTPLRLGIVLTVLNIVLNVIFIRGLGPIPAFGTLGAAVAAAVVAFPLLVQTMRVAFEQINPAWEEAVYVYGSDLAGAQLGLVHDARGMVRTAPAEQPTRDFPPSAALGAHHELQSAP